MIIHRLTIERHVQGHVGPVTIVAEVNVQGDGDDVARVVPDVNHMLRVCGPFPEVMGKPPVMTSRTEER